jgi:hypothetical protein
VLQNLKIGFWSHTILLILNTKKSESYSHWNWFQTYPKLPIITKIKICNYNKTLNIFLTCCWFFPLMKWLNY